MFVVPPLPSGTRAQRSGVRVCLPRSSIRPPNRDDDVIVISVRFGHIGFPKPNRYHPDFGSPNQTEAGLYHARTELVLEGSRSGWIQNRAWYGFDGRWHLACTGGPRLGTI